MTDDERVPYRAPRDMHLNDDPLKHLLAYQQADEEGVIVLASRQAIHEVADILARLQALNGRLREGLREIRKIDQLDKTTTIDVDPAGCTYAVEKVDGYCAEIAAQLLSDTDSSAGQSDYENRIWNEGKEAAASQLDAMAYSRKCADDTMQGVRDAEPHEQGARAIRALERNPAAMEDEG